VNNILKIIFIAVVVSGISSLPVLSYSPFLDQSMEVYNVRARCELCHFGVKLNNYGQDFKKEWEISRDIAQSFKAVENLDSDKDGFINLDEIKAMTLPGDKTNFPKTKNKVSLKKSH